MPHPTAHSSTTVRFATGRAAEGPLIWAQLAIWDVFRWLPPDDTTLNLLVQCPVPAGRDLDDVLTALRHLVERHDALHTVFVDTPAGPVQRVLPDGELAVRIHDLGPFDVVSDLAETLRKAWFDIGADLPLRAAVLRRDGVCTTVLLAASHMAVDGWSLAIVRGDLENLLADPPIVVDPGQQPLQRLAYEQSDIGRRREAKALAYWQRHLASMPVSMYESIRGDRPPNLDWGLIQSPALALATNGLAARLGIPPATVLLCATTLRLAAWTGSPEAALRMIVSTRFRPASRGLVGAFNENALFRLGFDPSEPIATVLLRAADAALAAYAHCECDPRALDAMFASIAAVRGIEADGYCFFNDTRFTPQLPPPPAQDLPEAIEAALPATKLLTPVIDRVPKGANFFMFLTDLGDTAELMLTVEHGFLPGRTPVDFLASLEHLVVQAALDESRPTATLLRSAPADLGRLSRS